MLYVNILSDIIKLRFFNISVRFRNVCIVIYFHVARWSLACIFFSFRTLLPWRIFHISPDRLLFVPLAIHLTPSSPPHPSPKISSAVRPTRHTLDPIQSSTSFSQDIFCCSSHSPYTCPIQSSTSFSQDIFCCSSHSPDTWPHPILHILLQRFLCLFVPLSRHLTPSSPPHPSPKISLPVRPTLQTLDPIQSSTSFSKDFFACSSHSPDTCPHPVLHILLPRYLLLFVPLSSRVVTIRYPHDTIRIAILGSRYDTYRDTCWKWQNDLVNDAQRIAIVFVCNVKVMHVLCIMPSLTQLFLYRYWQNYSRLIYMVENDQNLIIVSRAE